MFFPLLCSQIRHGSKLPQTVCLPQYNSPLYWRTHHSYPAIDQEVTSHRWETLILRAHMSEWYSVAMCIVLYTLHQKNDALFVGTMRRWAMRLIRNSACSDSYVPRSPSLIAPGISTASTRVWVVLGWVKEQAVCQVEGCAQYFSVTDCSHKGLNNIPCNAACTI